MKSRKEHSDEPQYVVRCLEAITDLRSKMMANMLIAIVVVGSLLISDLVEDRSGSGEAAEITSQQELDHVASSHSKGDVDHIYTESLSQ